MPFLPPTQTSPSLQGQHAVPTQLSVASPACARRTTLKSVSPARLFRKMFGVTAPPGIIFVLHQWSASVASPGKHLGDFQKDKTDPEQLNQNLWRWRHPSNLPPPPTLHHLFSTPLGISICSQGCGHCSPYTVTIQRAEVGVELLLAPMLLRAGSVREWTLANPRACFPAGRAQCPHTLDQVCGHSLERQCMKVLRCRLWIQIHSTIPAVLLSSSGKWFELFLLPLAHL